MSIDEVRVNVHLSVEQCAMVQSAAEIAGMTLADFAVQSMERHAWHVLSERRLFRISDEAWDAFEAMLNRPPVRKPRLARLLDQCDSECNE